MRVALTRPPEDSAPLSRRLAALGHTPVVAPVIRIVARPVAIADAMPDAVIVTSRHAVAALTGDQRGRLTGTPVLAVGTATAAAARAAGFTDIRVGGETATALRDLVRLTLPRPARLLYLAGAVHKPDLPDALCADGHALAVAVAYDAAAIGWDAATVDGLRADPPAVWVHYSRRSASLALSAARDAGLGEAFGAARHACLSEDVAAPLRAAGITRIGVAAQPNGDSLGQAVAEMITASPE